MRCSFGIQPKGFAPETSVVQLTKSIHIVTAVAFALDRRLPRRPQAGRRHPSLDNEGCGFHFSCAVHQSLPLIAVRETVSLVVQLRGP